VVAFVSEGHPGASRTCRLKFRTRDKPDVAALYAPPSLRDGWGKRQQHMRPYFGGALASLVEAKVYPECCGVGFTAGIGIREGGDPPAMRQVGRIGIR
jgi:hypothetical protein